MGKIQEALDRLKTDNPGTQRREPGLGGAPKTASASGIPSGATIGIDWTRLSAHELVPEEVAEAEMKQQFRRVKRPLLRQLFSSHPVGRLETGRILLVCSALRDEGKSFTSLNLALAIAVDPELKVLLIDGDVPKQALTCGFGLEGKPGLLDLAAEEPLEPEACIYSTSVDGFFVMPAGGRRSNSPELLGSSRAHEVLANITTKSGPCVVVIDSPPLLLANDGRALSSLADKILFVVRSGVTNASSVESALESIENLDDVSLMLNCSSQANKSEHRYGYEYGYDVTTDDSANRGR